jgi:DNA-binding IclR family transcriptional regulator
MAYELRSLERALEILGFLATVEQATLSEVCEKCDINTTTCLRTMRVMERNGFVRRSPDGKQYMLGLRLAELGTLALGRIDMVSLIRPLARSLTEEFRVTAHIGLLRDGMVTVIDKIDSPDGFVRYSLLGTRMPLHCSGMGKAILALFGPDRLAEAGLKPPLTRFTRDTITDMEWLAADIVRCAERGYSIEQEEWQPGFCCTGTAFTFNGDHYAVSLSGVTVPASELEERGRRLSAAVREFLRAQGAAVSEVAY